MNLENMLKKYNLTAYKFAKESEIPYMTVWRWLKGRPMSPIYKKVVIDFFIEKEKKALHSL